jgi:3-oxoacyl-[acyl-carrier-protein] synthase III
MTNASVPRVGQPPRANAGRVGVRIAGTGHALPAKRMTNADLEKLMETSDEWIVQRTGIRERRVVDRDKGESAATLSADALRLALADARLTPDDLDLIIVATMTTVMACPATACLVAHYVGANRAAAFDLNAACSGFVFGMNVAHDMIKSGAFRTVAVIGADTLTEHMSYTNAGRGTAIIFGDGAGAAVLRATDDAGKGVLAQAMHADGEGWKDIYIPEHPLDFPKGVEPKPELMCKVQMNGASVFKFAVGAFPNLIAETLEKAGLKAADIDMFVCHQSNARILAAARERFGIGEEKLYVNIDRVGNTVAASVPICLDELRKAGRIQDGQKVLFVAFGGGLTWGSSLWQL